MNGISMSALVVKISFSDLEFGEKVGSGGFGTVFKGRWKSKGMDVAIKRLQNRIRKEEVSLHSFHMIHILQHCYSTVSVHCGTTDNIF